MASRMTQQKNKRKMKTKNKFTPGPWKIHTNKPTFISEVASLHAKGFPFDIEGGDGFRPCACYSDGRLNAGTAAANAHLISAAPDLLAALEYVVQWHREHDSGEGELFGLDYVTTCIAAIRKAKGQQ